jgi:DNA-binding NarL/FixJ family response regulator
VVVITVALVADSAAAMEAMTSSVSVHTHMQIVRRCHGDASTAPVLARCAADLVLVDEMDRPRLALQRIAEIRQTLPCARIVVRAARPEAQWLAEALRVGANAVVPATAGCETLGLVLAEVAGDPPGPVDVVRVLRGDASNAPGSCNIIPLAPIRRSSRAADLPLHLCNVRAGDAA